MFRIPANAQPDALAYYRNGFQAVRVASDTQLTPSSLAGVATQIGPASTIPNCLQPPAHFDPLHTSDALLNAYGIAPRGEMPVSKWLKLALAPAKRACQFAQTNTMVGSVYSGGNHPGVSPLSAHGYQNGIWAGNVADQNCASNPPYNIACQDETHNYTETDDDYYVACPEYTPQISNELTVSAWVGVGGIDNEHELNQDGTTITYTQGTNGNFSTQVNPFWEFLGPAGTTTAVHVEINGQYVTANCGDHMFAEITQDSGWSTYWLKNLTQGWNFYWNDPLSPLYSPTSAEQILEAVNNQGAFLNADTTFYGAGVTDTKHNPNYIAYSTAQHDYENVYIAGTIVLSTGHTKPAYLVGVCPGLQSADTSSW